MARGACFKIGLASESHLSNFAHNSRTQKKEPSYLLPKEFRKKNEWVNRGSLDETTMEVFNRLIGARIKTHELKTGRRIQKKTRLNISAIVNLEAHHTLGDISPIVGFLERELGTIVIEGALHRDEGYVNDDGEPVYNYHAHLEFLGLDEEGVSVTRKIKPAFLRKLQKVTAETLGMAYETGSKRKGVSHKSFKADVVPLIKKEREAGLVQIKDIKALYSQAREELKKTKSASQKDYQDLKKKYEELKDKAKSKALNLDDAREALIGNLVVKGVEVGDANEYFESTKGKFSFDKHAVKNLADRLHEMEKYALSLEQRMTANKDYVESMFVEFEKQRERLNEERNRLYVKEVSLLEKARDLESIEGKLKTQNQVVKKEEEPKSPRDYILEKIEENHKKSQSKVRYESSFEKKHRPAYESKNKDDSGPSF